MAEGCAGLLCGILSAPTSDEPTSLTTRPNTAVPSSSTPPLNSIAASPSSSFPPTPERSATSTPSTPELPATSTPFLPPSTPPTTTTTTSSISLLRGSPIDFTTDQNDGLNTSDSPSTSKNGVSIISSSNGFATTSTLEPTHTSISNNSNRRPRTITIIAGTIGAVIGLLLVLVFLWCTFSRKRNAPIRQILKYTTASLRKPRERVNPERLEFTNGANEVNTTGLKQPTMAANSTETGEQATPNITPAQLSIKAGLVQQSEMANSNTQQAGVAAEYLPPIPSQEPPRGDVTAPEPSAQAMSIMLQEIQSLRMRMDEMARNQQQEAPRYFLTASGDVEDDQIAPPSYSDDGR